jgi:hypothetical protein
MVLFMQRGMLTSEPKSRRRQRAPVAVELEAKLKIDEAEACEVQCTAANVRTEAKKTSAVGVPAPKRKQSLTCRTP